ncbi:hypothetical protein F4861DRAFT_511595 [Xylaria intraflava]|nr:hypothetical protein F4861DRAFT_511595 [Xylaria intraflava]
MVYHLQRISHLAVRLLLVVYSRWLLGQYRDFRKGCRSVRLHATACYRTLAATVECGRVLPATVECCYATVA